MHAAPPRDAYVNGHQQAVLRSYSWRTAENSAAYLLPHLRPGLRLLDLGCGSGTITADLAQRVGPEGSAVGVDVEASVLQSAAAHAASRGVVNATFVEGSAYALPFPDGTFDVVHAHQVLQHLSDPVSALREALRVLKPGGFLAARDSDYSCFSWSPRVPGLDAWHALYRRIATKNGGDPDAGPKLAGWAREAGFAAPVAVSSSTWTFAEEVDRAWWGGTWAERCTASNFAEQAVAYGFVGGSADLEELAAAWRTWAADPDGAFFLLHGEVIARKPQE